MTTVHLQTSASMLVSIPLSAQVTDCMARCATEATPLLDITPPVVVFGKECKQHRNVGFFADPDVHGYAFAGQVSNNKTITPSMYELTQHVNHLLQVHGHATTLMNGVLVNQYMSGTDYIGKHSDKGVPRMNLTETGVAILSHGASRTFRVRDKSTGNILANIKTRDDEMLLMCGAFQQEFTHEIPVEKKVTTPRISFTFRKHNNNSN